MAKPVERPYSRHTRSAVRLLGELIRQARIECKITAAELAERVGVSRGLIQRIEQGDPGCSIGAAFEAATILGIPLFDVEPARVAAERTVRQQILALLPKTARPSGTAVKDDF